MRYDSGDEGSGEYDYFCLPCEAYPRFLYTVSTKVGSLFFKQTLSATHCACN